MSRKFKNIEDVKDIIRLYHEGTKVKDLALMYNISRYTIHNITHGRTYREIDRPPTNSGTIIRATTKLPSLTEKQLNVITGSLLGDGSIIVSQSNCNAYFTKKQCRKSKEHLEWLHKILQNYSKPVRDYSRKLNDGTNNDFSTFKTCCYPIFYDIRIKWYPDEKKIIPKDITLNADIVAIWFCDDGYNDPEHRRAFFCTDGFTAEDCYLLINRLEIDLGIVSSLNLIKGRPRICINSNYYKKFIELIKPHVIWKCFQYKIDLSNYKELRYNLKGKKLVGPSKLTVEHVQKIVDMYLNDNKSIKEICCIYKMSKSQITNILNGKAWGTEKILRKR